MKLHISDDGERPDRKPVHPAPDYTSRATKLRLMSLFAALVLVLVIMKEARKPERWAWLGLDSVAEKESSKNNLNNSHLPGGEGDLSDSESDLSKLAPASDHRQVNSGLSEPLPNQDSGGGKFPTDEDDTIRLAEFWKSTFQRLSLTEQRDLGRLFRVARLRNANIATLNDAIDSMPNAELKPEVLVRIKAVVKRIEFWRQQKHTDLLRQSSMVASNNVYKRRLSDRLVVFQEEWQAINRVFDATYLGQTVELGLVSVLNQVQSHLDAAAFASVNDLSPMTRTSDGPAWLRAWEMVLTETGVPVDPQELEQLATTQIQLASQPVMYRAKWVRVKGSVLGAKRIKIRKNELGIDGYYVIWMRPSDSDVAPYCLYTLRLPDGFPTVEYAFTEMYENAEAQGLFFKLRTYETAENTISSCPLILAHSFDWQPIQRVSSEATWNPPRWLIIVLICLMPCAASAIALWVYRSTNSRPLSPTGKESQKIEQTLVRLADDPEIMSDSERVRQLFQSESENG